MATASSSGLQRRLVLLDLQSVRLLGGRLLLCIPGMRRQFWDTYTCFRSVFNYSGSLEHSLLYEHYVLVLFLEVCDASWEQSAAVTPTLAVSRYLGPEPPLNSTLSQCNQKCHNLHATLLFAETAPKLQNLLQLIHQKHMASYIRGIGRAL